MSRSSARAVAVLAVGAALARGAVADSIWLDALFQVPALQQVQVNASGSLIAAHAFRDDQHALIVRSMQTGQNAIVSPTMTDLEYWWLDDDSLLVRRGEYVYDVIDVDTQDGQLAVQERKVRVWGQLVDPLPRVPDEVIWATSFGYSTKLYRLPISELVNTGERHIERFEVARLSSNTLRWVSDRNGVPRAALAVTDVEPVTFELLYRADADADWTTLGRWGPFDRYPEPIAMAANGRDLLVVSSDGSDTAVLREFLVDEEQLGRVIYANPSFDIVDVVFGYESSELIAVVYEEEGLRRYHYLDPLDAAQQQKLDALFPGKAVHLTSHTHDRRYFTVLTADPRDPGRYHIVDTQSAATTDLGEVLRRIDPKLMAPVGALGVTAKDGRRIDAFLALPVSFGGELPPLVVMPHGGPIGVSDRREFDPVVQSLTTGGYAVLQVNYRGSAGRGRDFLEAGKGAFGREIEDDIEAALDAVLGAGKVDPARICVFGGSYGGYSALISITRRPQRYRCAAALSAPSDLLLILDSSDFAATEEGREHFAEVVGDPDRDREHLIEISPAYRAREMDVPILLIHGDRDLRVDVEHAYRMKAMLEAYGKTPEWMLIRDGEHSLTRHQWMRVMERVLEFLDAHLGPGAKSH